MDQMEVEVAKASQEWGEVFDRAVEEKFKTETFSFLMEDLVSKSGDALLNIAVMCRQQFIKLMILQDLLENQLKVNADKQGEIKLGVEGFKKSG